MASKKTKVVRDTPTEAPEQSTDQKLAAAEEALRLQELDAAEMEERIATLEAQQAKAAEAKSIVTNLPTVEHDGKQYRFLYHALRINGKRLTADQIAEDELLVQQLIENGSAAIEAL